MCKLIISRKIQKKYILIHAVIFINMKTKGILIWQNEDFSEFYLSNFDQNTYSFLDEYKILELMNIITRDNAYRLGPCYSLLYPNINIDGLALNQLYGMPYTTPLKLNLLDGYDFYEYDVLFRTQLAYTYETLNEESKCETKQFNKELVKLQEQLYNLNHRYATDKDFDKEIYKSIKGELEHKISNLRTEISKLESNLSNPENYFQISADVAKNLSKYWCSDSLETKRRIQELVFKGSLSLDVKNRTYLTKEINCVFGLSAELTRDTEGVNEKRQPISQLPSSLVAGARLERTTFGL